MKDIRPRIIDLLRSGNCTPQISSIAKSLKEPSTTIHYNIKKLEEQRAILKYKTVFDYKQIGEGFCSYILLSLDSNEYGDPEKVAADLAKHKEIESVDICTGDWEIIIKVRAKDIDAYYQFIKTVIRRKGVNKIVSLNSLKQVKSEFVSLTDKKTAV